MKELSYIKLFEAFKSSIISKTLNHVKDKQGFMSIITEICLMKDMPESELSDEYFEYLPFNRALNRTSDEIIDGTNSGINLVKFWFDKDGKYITMSGYSGLSRSGSGSGSLDIDINHYKSTPISSYDVFNLRDGSIVAMDIRKSKNIVCYILRDYDERCYAIQDYETGKLPNIPSWDTIASKSYVLQNGNFSNPRLLEFVGVGQKPNPYLYNFPIVINNGEFKEYKAVLSEVLKEAHYAIIFNYTKFINANSSLKSSKENSRHLSKLGSRLDPYQSDSEIKRRNIKRYIDKMSKDFKLSDDLGYVDRIIKKLLTGKYAFYAIASLPTNYDITTIIKLYFMSFSVDGYIKDLEEIYKRIIREYSNYLINIGSNIRLTEEYLKKNNKHDILNIFNILNRLSLIIYKKVSSIKVETIEDMEVVYMMVTSIKNLIYSDRYRSLYEFYTYVIPELYSTNTQYYRHLPNAGSIGDITKTILDLTKTIEKMPTKV